MNRREILRIYIATSMAMGVSSVRAQIVKPAASYRVGLLPGLNVEQRAWFTSAMSQLGFVEGNDYELFDSDLKFRPYAELIRTRMVAAPPQSRPNDLDAGTREMMRRQPDVIVATSTAYAVAAQRAAPSIPVVMWSSGYPVEAGLADSLSHPGGNVTGNTIYAGIEIWGKLLQLLREAKPSIRRVGVLWDYVPPTFPRQEIEPGFKEIARASGVLGLETQIIETPSADALPKALAAMDSFRAEGLVVTSGWGLLDARQALMEHAVKRRLPVIVDFRWRSPVEPYPLLVYGVQQGELMRNAASYVVSILRGGKPGDMPILQPSKYEFVVNAKMAASLGIEIPRSLMIRADEVLK